MGKRSSQKDFVNTPYYPPVVTVVGHVDHGKTTLLDTIRKTTIAKREQGGITQKIGVSTVEVVHEGIKRRITFIDTPGHETFYKMRGRGVQVSDIALLVVSSVDGVQPQTIESINLLKESNVPFIVVLTKTDVEHKNPEKAKQQLLKEHVLLEGYGGNVPSIEVSALTGRNIQELLELVLLVNDVRHKEPDVSPDALLRAVVIESKLDIKAGPRATVVIKNGTLRITDEVVSDGVEGKIRMIVNDQALQLESATIGEGVEVLGFREVPVVGSIVVAKEQYVKKDTRLEEAVAPQGMQQPAPLFRQKENEQSELPLIICADNSGSLEAILAALPKKVRIILAKTGEITIADVLMAKSVKGIVLGFNVKLRGDVIKLAVTEKVLVKNYTVIYELVDEVADAIEGKKIAGQETIYGKAKVQASFPFEKTKVLGVFVLEGRIAKGDRVRLMRGDTVLGESTLISLRQGKDQISKAEKGKEAGVILSPFLDFTIGDVVLCHG